MSFVGDIPSYTWALLVHPLPNFFWEGTLWPPSRAAIISFFAFFGGLVLGFGLGVSLGYFCSAIAFAVIPCLLFWDCVKYPCVKAGWLICGLTALLISVPPAPSNINGTSSPSTFSGGGDGYHA